MSVRIANSRGIPGTLGCLARTVHQHRPVFLTSCHVLFAAGAARSDPVWRVEEIEGRRNYSRLGSALQGKCGIVRFRGDDYHVDCAIGALDQPQTGKGLRIATPRHGERVFKTGAATGATTGVIVDSSYTADPDGAENRRDTAPRQLLVRSTEPGKSFAAEGDSGALILNQDHAVLGLLWGATVAGEGVACPIGPVLHALNIRLEEADA